MLLRQVPGRLRGHGHLVAAAGGRGMGAPMGGGDGKTARHKDSGPQIIWHAAAAGRSGTPCVNTRRHCAV
jgi:hypothetical protein